MDGPQLALCCEQVPLMKLEKNCFSSPQTSKIEFSLSFATILSLGFLKLDQGCSAIFSFAKVRTKTTILWHFLDDLIKYENWACLVLLGSFGCPSKIKESNKFEIKNYSCRSYPNLK